MQVFKFGGASVRNADSIRNLAQIVKAYQSEPLLIVVSAMDKTTNKLEQLLNSYYYRRGDQQELFDKIKAFHFQILGELFSDQHNPIYHEIENTFVEIDWILEEDPQDPFDYLYDQMVSIGEMLSSRIVHAYLVQEGLSSKWLDVRNFIHTDNNHRDAHVEWIKTEESISTRLPPLMEQYICVTQGFIGGTSENFTTTLGRDGSDYSAAIFASCLNAKSITIWKDVPGVLNADPKWFTDTELIPELSYLDAIELSYYGANVIHPKTIKPLENKGITLHVRSFVDMQQKGTSIYKTTGSLSVPSFIFKVNQVLISILPNDFSFIVEDNLSHIFNLFHKHRVKINMMHNSAVSFSVSVDHQQEKVMALVEELRKDYEVSYVCDLELVTIRYYNQQTIDRVLSGKEVIQEVKDSYTCQMLIRDKTD